MDNGNPISIIFESAEFRSNEEYRNISRVTLGYLLAEYHTDTNLSVVIFYKQSNESEWEQTSAITIDKNKKRLFRLISVPSLTCYDFYIKLYGSVQNIFELTTLRILVKENIFGKHN